MWKVACWWRVVGFCISKVARLNSSLNQAFDFGLVGITYKHVFSALVIELVFHFECVGMWLFSYKIIVGMMKICVTMYLVNWVCAMCTLACVCIYSSVSACAIKSVFIVNHVCTWKFVIVLDVLMCVFLHVCFRVYVCDYLLYVWMCLLLVYSFGGLYFSN